MGLDTIPVRLDSQTITQDWYNLLARVVQQDFVPRNGSGIATDLAGNLGQSSTRWLSAFFQTLNLGATVNPLTLQAPTMSAPFSITLPGSAPASNLPLSMSPGGIITAAAITQAQRVSLPFSLSSSSGADFAGSNSTTYVDVANLSVSVTTSGRPVVAFLIPDGSTNPSVVQSATVVGYLAFVRDGSVVWEFNTDGTNVIQAPFIFWDSGASAGSHTFKIQRKQSPGGAGLVVQWWRLLVIEL
jgi:hypothetical protein